MQSDSSDIKSKPLHRIEINVRNVVQLFNTTDPSPFKEKDIDQDAEEFIVSWCALTGWNCADRLRRDGKAC